jgi:8-oxo-dGTP pyrophosphatase MutT (NUDIX family)
MSSLDDVRRVLAAHRPAAREAGGRAAVAVVLRTGTSGGVEVLLIERAHKVGDPWSGHMAFPGGRHDPADLSARHTAERETFEEVGLDLSTAELLGQLDDLEGRHSGRPAGLAISAFVFFVAEPEPLLIQPEEVQAAFWVPLARLVDPAAHVGYRFRHELVSLEMPGIRVGEPEAHVVWGLTYRFLEDFLALLGTPLADRWSPLASEA